MSTLRPVKHDKAVAIEVHEEQAELFRRRYEEMERDPYGSAFSYGRAKVEALLDAALPAHGKGLSLLDAGCGPGYNLHSYAGRGFAVAGLDAAPSMVEAARELNPGAAIELGDVETLPFEDASFDYLLSIEVIRYLAAPERALSEFARVLRPGGVALVTAMPPFALNGYALLNKLSSRYQVGGLTKVRQHFHTVGRLERLFRAAGFSEVEVDAAFWGPFVNVERVLPRVLPRLLRAWDPIDDRLTRFSQLRNLANHLVVVARRPGTGRRTAPAGSDG